MRLPRLLSVLLFCLAGLGLPAEPKFIPTQWDHISVAPMKTSIYIGSVRLTTGVFERKESELSTSYEAKVVPWFFWGESGRITIRFDDAMLAKLARGQTAEFTGDAMNQKNKPRSVTGRAQPTDESSGKIKVRVMADGIELIFNGTYEFGEKSS